MTMQSLRDNPLGTLAEDVRTTGLHAPLVVPGRSGAKRGAKHNRRVGVVMHVEIPAATCACCGSDPGYDVRLKACMAIVKLTGKEVDVCTLMVKGLSTKEMATALGNTEKTLKHHIASIFHRFHVASRMELISVIFPV